MIPNGLKSNIESKEIEHYWQALRDISIYSSMGGYVDDLKAIPSPLAFRQGTYTETDVSASNRLVLRLLDKLRC